MTRKTILSKKETYAKYQEVMKEHLNEPMELSHNALVERAGGSISNLPVKTKEFADWLQDQRERNPLIGRDYIEAAPEYNSEQIKMNDEKELYGSDATELVDKEESKAFDVEASQSMLSDRLGAALIGDDSHDTKFIDMAIISNATKQLLTSDVDSITTHATDELKKYHGDANYQTDINVTDVIEQEQILLIEEQNNYKLLK